MTNVPADRRCGLRSRTAAARGGRRCCCTASSQRRRQPCRCSPASRRAVHRPPAFASIIPICIAGMARGEHRAKAQDAHPEDRFSPWIRIKRRPGAYRDRAISISSAIRSSAPGFTAVAGMPARAGAATTPLRRLAGREATAAIPTRSAARFRGFDSAVRREVRQSR